MNEFIKSRDNRISFLEEPHLYLIDGKEVPGLLSVTQFIHRLFKPFDAKCVINNMMKSTNWLTSKYYGKSVDEIIKEWDSIKNDAADKGTKMHFAIEQFYTKTVSPEYYIQPDKEILNTVEYNHFMNFYKDYMYLKPFKIEWRIFDEVVKIAGSVDMVFHDPDNENCLYIYDWKRSKCINFSNRFQKGLGELNHLDDCNFNHYSLQLNIYKKIIETNYKYKVTKLAIVVFHPNNPTYIKIDIPNLDNEVELIWNNRLNELKV